MTTTTPMTAAAETAWFAHCAEMQRLYEAKAAELVAAGWRRQGRGRWQYFTKAGAQPLVIRRQLGSRTWYTMPQDF